MGPSLASSMNLFSFASSPAASASTSPDGKFLHHPASPSASARSFRNARKRTPCTLPLIVSLHLLIVSPQIQPPPPKAPILFPPLSASLCSRATRLSSPSGTADRCACFRSSLPSTCVTRHNRDFLAGDEPNKIRASRICTYKAI